MRIDITVAICTWNRAALLDQTLACLAKLDVPAGLRWELIVVDNNSTDDTALVLAKHSDRLPLVSLKEAKQGHSHARNRAVAAARGPLVLWTDDDVLVPAHWLAEYVTAAARFPTASWFGGPVRPWFESPPPSWIADNLSELGICWALLDYGPDVREMKPPEYVYGANIAFRTEVMKRFPFDPAYGRVGTQLSSGDETRVQDAVAAAGGHGVWIGTAPVDHFLPARRMTVSHARNILYWMGHRGYAPFADDAAPRILGAPRWLWKRYLTAAVHRRRLSLKKNPAWVAALKDEAKSAGLLRRFREEAGK